LLTPAKADLLLFNPSASLPIGFYMRETRSPRVGDVVTVRARDVAASYAASRDFADPSDRFLKYIAAGEGDLVCAEGSLVTINGRAAALRLEADAAGRSLPSWQGCEVLRRRVFLLGRGRASFDARYWGPIPATSIEGVWRPLWISRRGDFDIQINPAHRASPQPRD
jgi:type IV secretory pathway protease TraF